MFWTFVLYGLIAIALVVIFIGLMGLFNGFKNNS